MNDSIAASMETWLPLYRAMVTARVVDQREKALVNQGLAFFHVSGAGHEAAAALVPHLTADDWLHCHYRDKAMLLLRGVPIVDFFMGLLCKAASSSQGRQMSAHLSSPDHHVLSMVGPVGNNALQAVGVAAAVRDRSGRPIVVCSVGDGTTQEGEFLEACAEAARSQLPVLFLVEDNEWAISTSTVKQTFLSLPDGPASEFHGMPIERIDGTDAPGAYHAFARIVERMRELRCPAIVHFAVKRLSDHTNADDQELYRNRDEIDRCSRDCDPIHRLARWLETNGIPAATLEQIEDESGTAVLEAETQALDGAEPEPILEAKTPLPSSMVEPEAERRGDGAPELTMREALRDVLGHHLRQDARVILSGEDIEDPKGDVFGVTRGLSHQFPGRVRNSALSESTIVGTAIGRALAGERPVAFIQFADFLPLAFNQIASELGSMYWRSGGRWQTPVIVMVTCGGYRPGLGPFHSQSLEALAIHTPGIDVMMPSTATDAAGMLNAAFASGRPTLFFYPKALLNRSHDTTPRDTRRQFVPIGVARTLREGRHITLVGWGNTVSLCAKVARALADAEVEAEVIDLRSLSPWDESAVLESVGKTRNLIVVHEDNRSCGLGAEIVATVAEKSAVPVQARRITRPDTLVPCNFANQLEILPSFQRTLAAAAEMLDLDLTWEMPKNASEAGGSLFAVAAIGSGPSDEAVRILRLVARAGRMVCVGDVLAEVEASKACLDITSPVAGVIEQVLVREEELVAVGQPIVVIRTNVGARPRPITEEHAGRPVLRRRAPVPVPQVPNLLPECGEIGIAVIASALGSRKILNDDLLAHHPGRSATDVFRRTGIDSRNWIEPGESVLTLAVRAARKALERAGLMMGDIHRIICATVTPDVISPSLACRVLAELCRGAAPVEIPAFDINAACSGYLYALQLAHEYLEPRPDERVLVITSEVLSERVDPTDFDTAFLFGDAASATVVVGGNHRAEARFALSRPIVSAKGDADESLRVPLIRNGRGIEMRGTRIFSEATRAMVAILKDACGRDSIAPEQLSLVVPHQANQRILDAVAERVGVPVFSNIRELGNTSSSTIPLALEAIWKSVPAGQHLGLCAFGGGFTSGAAVLQALPIQHGPMTPLGPHSSLSTPVTRDTFIATPRP
jgi:2-oxoisovalerate dehydrogenase E1 component